MTKNQLESSLDAIGVHPSSFSLGSIRNSECVCVVSENGEWKVYYVERDKPEELAASPSEEAAYDFVYATFRKWMGVKTP